MNRKIEIRCRRANCNKLFMNYFHTGESNGLYLAGIELKCEKCKRVLRLKNYTEEVLMANTKDGVFHV